MNPAQMAQQIKHELTTVVWPGEGGTVVFGAYGVRVFAGTPTEKQIPPGFPWALVGIGNGEPDADAPDLILQTFDVIAGVDGKGDPMGEFAIIGGPAASLLRSAGRGVAEVAARVRSAVGDLTGADGAPITLDATAIDTPQLIATGRHIVVDGLTLSALCTSELEYSAPQQIEVSGSTWTWEGAHCSDRFDFLQYRFGYVSGSAPVDSPDDLDTIVYTGADTTKVLLPASGVTYQVFADYNGRGGTSVEGSSPSEVGGYYVSA